VEMEGLRVKMISPLNRAPGIKTQNRMDWVRVSFQPGI